MKAIWTLLITLIFVVGCGDDDTTETGTTSTDDNPTDKDDNEGDTGNEDDGTDDENSNEDATDESTDDESTDETPTGGLDFVANEDGWVDGSTNDLGVQGPWYEFGDDGYSTIERDGMCAEGTIALVEEDDDGNKLWDDIWGAGIGFNLCLTGAEQDPPEEEFTLSECPIADDLDTEFGGIIFDLTGEIGTGPLRVTFAEGDGASAYIEFDEPGTELEANIELARILWDNDNDQPYVNIADVHSVQFALPANDGDAYDYDFCIENIKLIQGQSDEGANASGDEGDDAEDEGDDAEDEGDGAEDE